MSRASLCQLLHRARGQCRLLWSHRVKTSKQCHHNFQETVNYWVCWRFNSDLALKSQIVLLVEVNALQLSVIQDEKDISSKLLEKSDKTCWVKNLSLVENLALCRLPAYFSQNMMKTGVSLICSAQVYKWQDQGMLNTLILLKEIFLSL